MTAWTASAVPPPVEVLLVGFDPAAADRLGRELAAEGVTACGAATADEGMARLQRQPAGVVCLGPRLAGEEAARFLQRTAFAPAAPRCNVVLAGGDDAAAFQQLVDEDRLFFLTREPPAEGVVRDLLAAAVARARAEGPGSSAPAAAAAVGDAARETVLELYRQWTPATGAAEAAALVARAARTLVEAERARCLLYDPASDSFSEDGDGGADGDGRPAAESCASGLVAFAIRTGRAVRLDRVADDARWDPAADTAHGSPDDRLLVQPLVVDGEGAGRVWAALALSRGAGAPPFTAAEAASVAFLARHAAPLAARFTLRRELDARAGGDGAAAGGRLFRRQALTYHAGGLSGQRSRPLEISPSWVGRAFAVLVVLVVTAVAFLSLAHIDQYASGPAVVRADGRTDVTARLAGTVSEVAVAPGQPVAAGDLLVRLDGDVEKAELERIDRELELALAQRLRDPQDGGVEARMQSLRASRQLAAARLEARSVRAPHAGVVGDLRTHAGMQVAPGEVLVSLASERGDLSLVVLLPAHYRPMLHAGMPLRFELDGYRYAYQELTIERIDDQAVGPAEARRILGSEIGDALPVTAPVVFASVRLPASGTFRGDGGTYPYHEGLRGTAEVRVRSERVLPALVPGLKALTGGSE